MAATRPCKYIFSNNPNNGRANCPNSALDTNSFCEQHAYELGAYNYDRDIFKTVAEHYRQDLREFWSRFSLLHLGQAFLFAAFATLVTQPTVVNNRQRPPHWHDVIFEATLGFIGLLSSVAARRLARSSAAWVRRWKTEVLLLHNKINVDKTYRSYTRVEEFEKDGKLSCQEKKLLRAGTRSAMTLPTIFVAGWSIVVPVAVVSSIVDIIRSKPVI